MVSLRCQLLLGHPKNIIFLIFYNQNFFDMYTMDDLNDKLLSELKEITEELGIKVLPNYLNKILSIKF